MANAPLDGALPVTGQVESSVPDATSNDTKPRCALCPLCMCHSGCRGVVDEPGHAVLLAAVKGGGHRG